MKIRIVNVQESSGKCFSAVFLGLELFTDFVRSVGLKQIEKQSISESFRDTTIRVFREYCICNVAATPGFRTISSLRVRSIPLKSKDMDKITQRKTRANEQR